MDLGARSWFHEKGDLKYIIYLNSFGRLVIPIPISHPLFNFEKFVNRSFKQSYGSDPDDYSKFKKILVF